VFDAGDEAEIRAGAPLVDTVIVQGLNTPDVIVASVPNVLDNNYLVTGLPYNILVASSDGTVANGALRDQFVLNGNGGDDNLKGLPPLEDVTRVTIDGGEGDDFISADAILNGGPDNDTLVGGAGPDTYNGGAGDDILVISDGDDTMNGDAGFDIVLYRGTNAGETLSLSQAYWNYRYLGSSHGRAN
jgi:Ca2+-binding RTX toxin-like protein